MPTYDYECDACRHKFEEFQSMSDRLLRKCPACGKKRLRRLFGTGAGIIFKGSGFYETDYKKKTGVPAAGSEAKTETKEGGKAEAKPDSKGETKTETKTDPKPESKSDSKSGSPSGSKSPSRDSAGKKSRKGS